MDKNTAKMMKDNWSRGKKLKDGLPDGEYVARLQNAEVVESKNGNPMIKREHLVVEGEFAGQVVFDNIVLSSEFGCGIACKWLDVCGHEAPDDPSDIEDVVAAIAAEGSTFVIKTRSKDGFTNVTAIEMTEAGEGEEKEEEEEEEVDVEEEEEEEEEEEDNDDDDDDESEEEEEEEEEPAPKPKSKGKKGATDSKQRDELAAFCAAQDVEGIDESSSLTEMIDAIRQYGWPAADLTEDEVAMLRKIGATVEEEEEKPAPKPKAKPAKPAKPAAKGKKGRK